MRKFIVKHIIKINPILQFACVILIMALSFIFSGVIGAVIVAPVVVGFAYLVSYDAVRIVETETEVEKRGR